MSSSWRCGLAWGRGWLRIASVQVQVGNQPNQPTHTIDWKGATVEKRVSREEQRKLLKLEEQILSCTWTLPLSCVIKLILCIDSHICTYPSPASPLPLTFPFPLTSFSFPSPSSLSLSLSLSHSLFHTLTLHLLLCYPTSLANRSQSFCPLTSPFLPATLY